MSNDIRSLPGHSCIGFPGTNNAKRGALNVSSKLPSDADAPGGDSPPSALLIAIGQFNRGEYYDAHETLEELWLEEDGPLRSLYQGILQVGVGLYHWGRGNYRGADALLERGLTLLGPFRSASLGLDIDRFIVDASAAHGELRRLGPRRMARYESARFPRIYYLQTDEDKGSEYFV